MSLPASGVSRTVDVVNASGAKAGTVELPAELFDVTANIPLIHQVVVAQLAAARQGTHSTKGRGEVRGGGTKPYRQKGTGRARQGSIRAPQYVGGGVVHGPQPHGYAQRTPKKMIAAALRGALSDRAREGRVHVISDLVSGDSPSTKSAVAALRGITASDKVLVVIHRDEDLAWLSLRNVITVHTIAVDQLNAYDVLVNDEVVFTSSALEAFVAGATASGSGKVIARESETALVSSEVSESPAVPVTVPEQDEEPEYTEPDELSAPSDTSAEPDELSAPADTSAESGEATSDTGPVSGQAPPSPVSSGPASATSEPDPIEEEDDK
jgi:large subunit ribosomal protein L4